MGFFCSGGSPNSKDVCTKNIPQAITLTATGQAHVYGKIIINVDVNYLPLSLIQSSSDCSNQCMNVLSAKIISGFSSTTGIVVSYLPSTSFSFSVTVNFGVEPIGLFGISIGINPNLVQRYFSGINTSQTLTVNINPAFLAVVGQGASDILT